jgi:phosphoribosylformylglycinamidine cyclo-ligase
LGAVERNECYRVMNMGFGYLLIVRPEAADAVLGDLRGRGEPATLVGEILAGNRTVRLT